METEFRLAKAEDADAIAKLVQENLGGDFVRKISASLVKEKLKDKKDVFVLAVAGGKIIGVSRASYEDEDLAEIRWLAVEKNCRNCGIGTNLVEKTIDELKEKGKRKVTARVKTTSTIPIEIFSRLGFDKEGYFKEHYRKGVDIIQFGKII
ncbi:MAG: GNAT family N-acetyltransferase [Candidatus Aenigmatarchaeota archaeon]